MYMGESSNFKNSWTFEIQILKLAVYMPSKYYQFQVYMIYCPTINWKGIREAILICLIQRFKAA